MDIIHVIQYSGDGYWSLLSDELHNPHYNSNKLRVTVLGHCKAPSGRAVLNY